MLRTCWGLFAMKSWARWTAVFIATLSAILQVGVLPAFPLWALLIITIDVYRDLPSSPPAGPD